jgi:uncharacterized protein (TIGR03435 family)
MLLKYHNEPLPAHELTVSNGSVKLRQSTAPVETPPLLVNRILPAGRMQLPASSAKMTELASMLQRSVLDRPFIDKTNLTA